MGSTNFWHALPCSRVQKSPPPPDSRLMVSISVSNTSTLRKLVRNIAKTFAVCRHHINKPPSERCGRPLPEPKWRPPGARRGVAGLMRCTDPRHRCGCSALEYKRQTRVLQGIREQCDRPTRISVHSHKAQQPQVHYMGWKCWRCLPPPQKKNPKGRSNCS